MTIPPPSCSCDLPGCDEKLVGITSRLSDLIALAIDAGWTVDLGYNRTICPAHSKE